MKTRTLKSIAAVLLVASWHAPNTAARANNVRKAVREVSPAVVMVVALDQNQEATGFGSGFFIEKDGLVVSNYHVVKGAYQVAIRTRDKEVYEAIGVVDFNEDLDYVVMRVPTGNDFSCVRLQNSQQLEIGDEVVAIGHPHGLEYTISTGIISQIRHVEGLTLIQHTAPISPGNSGGPLIAKNGKVIGINTMTAASGQNLNFAIPIDYIQTSIRDDKTAKWTFRYLASRQAELQRWTRYEDPDGLYSLAYPSDWKVKRASGWSQDRTVYTQSTMFAPDDAYRAQGSGHLPEGIRVTIQVADEGHSFAMATPEEYGQYFVNATTNSGSNLVLTSVANTSFCGQDAKVYSFVAQGQSMPEPQEIVVVVVANEKYRVLIEMVSPTSRLQEYAAGFKALIKSFNLG